MSRSKGAYLTKAREWRCSAAEGLCPLPCVACLAMEALVEMQQQQVVRFLGVTGHYRPDPLIDAVTAAISTPFSSR